MIQAFVDKFIAQKDTLIAAYKAQRPTSYDQLFTDVVRILHDDDAWACPDPTRIHVIDDGDYQGTRLFIVAATGYQPSTYWAVSVSYGSCSGCDSFEGVGYGDDVTDEEATEYWTMALHMVQGLIEI